MIFNIIFFIIALITFYFANKIYKLIKDQYFLPIFVAIGYGAIVRFLAIVLNNDSLIVDLMGIFWVLLLVGVFYLYKEIILLLEQITKKGK